MTHTHPTYTRGIEVRIGDTVAVFDGEQQRVVYHQVAAITPDAVTLDGQPMPMTTVAFIHRGGWQEGPPMTTTTGAAAPTDPTFTQEGWGRG